MLIVSTKFFISGLYNTRSHMSTFFSKLLQFVFQERYVDYIPLMIVDKNSNILLRIKQNTNENQVVSMFLHK